MWHPSHTISGGCRHCLGPHIPWPFLMNVYSLVNLKFSVYSFLWRFSPLPWICFPGSILLFFFCNVNPPMFSSKVSELNTNSIADLCSPMWPARDPVTPWFPGPVCLYLPPFRQEYPQPDFPPLKVLPGQVACTWPRPWTFLCHAPRLWTQQFHFNFFWALGSI